MAAMLCVCVVDAAVHLQVVLTSLHVCVLPSRLRRGQMKEASEMKYGDQVEGKRTLQLSRKPMKRPAAYLCFPPFRSNVG